MNKINLYTIGFTKKTAEKFFNLLIDNNVEKVLDIRLNNTSQLSAFAKYPDIEYFLKEIAGIGYIHDKNFAPDKNTLISYKKGEITWEDYIEEFEASMQERDIEEYIAEKYSNINNYCLLCSEATPVNCHRSLLAQIFKRNIGKIEIKEL